MKKKDIILICSCLLLSTAFIIGLSVYSERRLNRPGSFIRLFPPHAISGITATLDVEDNSYYIAGVTDSLIYLANNKRPLHLLKLNTSLTNSQSIKLNISSSEKHEFRSAYISVVDSSVHLMDGKLPAIFSGNTKDWTIKKKDIGTGRFIVAEPIGPDRYAIKKITPSLGGILGKLTTEPYTVSMNPNILEKQTDGIFCTDGTMHFNNALQRLIYVYYYRNEYIVVSPEMDVKFRDHTIDTTSTAKFKIVSISLEDRKTMASPPPIVNRHSCSSGKWLFIHSKVPAKNESRNRLKNSSVIDIYNLEEQRYMFSFYLPDHRGNKLKDLKVKGSNIVALFDHYITTYKLKTKYLAN